MAELYFIQHALQLNTLILKAIQGAKEKRTKVWLGKSAVLLFDREPFTVIWYQGQIHLP